MDKVNLEAQERLALDLAAIKARLDEAKAAIDRGEPSINIGQFNMAQLGLSVPVIDKKGRLWRFEGQKLILVHEPAARLWDGQYSAPEAK